MADRPGQRPCSAFHARGALRRHPRSLASSPLVRRATGAPLSRPLDCKFRSRGRGRLHRSLQVGPFRCCCAWASPSPTSSPTNTRWWRAVTPSTLSSSPCSLGSILRGSSAPLVYLGLLALAANTNAHSFVLAAALALEAAYAARARILALDRKLLAAFLMYAAAAVVAALQAYPPHDINFTIRKPGDLPAIHALQLASEAFVERWDFLSTAPPSPGSRICGGVITVVLLIPALRLFAVARTLAVFLLLLVGLIGFSALKYGNAWHAGIIFLAFVFVLWISWGDTPRLSHRNRVVLGGALGLLFAVQVWCSAAAAARDLVETYSPAARVAALLAAPQPAGSPAEIGVLGFKAFAVQPYFARNIFANYEGGRPRPAYYLWRRAEQPIPGVSETEWRRTLSGGYRRLLLSGFNLMGLNGPYRYLQDARAAGYCPWAALPGGDDLENLCARDRRDDAFSPVRAALTHAPLKV